MPTYLFKCEPCEEHDYGIVREVHMSIDNFHSDSHMCDKCGKEMYQIFTKPHVVYKGKGFYATDYKKKLDFKNEAEMTLELEEHYVEKAIKNGNVDAARDATETFVVDKYRDTRTGKSVMKPVVVPPIQDD
jgi:predicted nucleic acid-binding Zn ribbon protein